MTSEEIKKLKAGDKFIVEYTVTEVRDHVIDILDITGERSLVDKHFSDLLKKATLVAPPPTFDVGDTVRIVPDPVTGTVYGCRQQKEELNGLETTVLSMARTATGDVCVRTRRKEADGNSIWGVGLISIHCLELVKKGAKDRYTIVDGRYEWRVCENCEGRVTVSAFTKEHHPNAKAAAEAECARLNAEWRKQQEGGAK